MLQPQKGKSHRFFDVGQRGKDESRALSPRGGRPLAPLAGVGLEEKLPPRLRRGRGTCSVSLAEKKTFLQRSQRKKKAREAAPAIRDSAEKMSQRRLSLSRKKNVLHAPSGRKKKGRNASSLCAKKGEKKVTASIGCRARSRGEKKKGSALRDTEKCALRHLACITR